MPYVMGLVSCSAGRLDASPSLSHVQIFSFHPDPRSFSKIESSDFSNKRKDQNLHSRQKTIPIRFSVEGIITFSPAKIKNQSNLYRRPLAIAAKIKKLEFSFFGKLLQVVNNRS